MDANPELVEAGDPDSLWPSIRYVVHVNNAMLSTQMSDTDAVDNYINFISTREPGVREEHLHPSKMGMREIVWERQYQSLLRGEDLIAYRQLLEQPWVRIAIARTEEEKWDSYWRANAELTRAGTLIFVRSWNAKIMAEIDVHFSPDYVTMFTDRLRVTLESEYDVEFDKKMANWLIMTKFWSIPFYPFPYDERFGEITSQNAAIAAFLLGGKGTLIISEKEPDITDMYSIVRRIHEKMHIPYVQILLYVIQNQNPHPGN